MKTISLEDACRLLAKAKVVHVDDGVVAEPTLYPLTGNGLNVFLKLEWQDMIGMGDEADFTEGDNRMVPVDGGKLALNDIAGMRYDLSLLVPMDVENYVPEKEEA